MIQIRHVPDPLYRRLKARAAAAGMTLSDYLRTELERLASQLSADEVRERLRQLEPVTLPDAAVATLRRTRGPLPSDEEVGGGANAAG